MQKKFLRVMAKLGEARDLLKVAGSMPECKRCADIIHSARLKVEDTIIEIGKQKAVDWGNVSVILEFISRLLTVMKLLGLNDF